MRILTTSTCNPLVCDECHRGTIRAVAVGHLQDEWKLCPACAYAAYSEVIHAKYREIEGKADVVGSEIPGQEKGVAEQPGSAVESRPGEGGV